MMASDTKLFLEQIAAGGGPGLDEMPLAEARAAYREIVGAVDEPLPPAVTCRDLSTDGAIALRLYRPSELTAPDRLVVYFHGGGWTIGDLETHHGFCGAMAAQLGARVVAVDYRLAPEHPFPAAHDDCLAAVEWIARSPATLGEPFTVLGLAGDSAGGNLAAATSIALRQASRPVDAQLLLYPVTDLRFGRPSYAAYGSGFGLDERLMTWFRTTYMPNVATWTDPRATLLGGEVTPAAPPSVVLTCELDILRDEGRAFAAGLVASGVPVHFIEAKGQIHGIATFRRGIPSANAPLRDAVAAFGRMLAAAL